MGEVERLQAVVHGRVQGVGFRYYTLQRATELGLVGYVKNKWDRTVEVVAEGERENLEMLASYLHIGPRGATVTHIDVTWLPASGDYHDFRPRF